MKHEETVMGQGHHSLVFSYLDCEMMKLEETATGRDVVVHEMVCEGWPSSNVCSF